MKHRLFTFLAMFAFVSGFFSCDEEGTLLEVKKNVTANQLQNLSANSYVFSQEAETEIFDTFKWTAPDFGFPAGGSYTLQADFGGNNFADPLNVITTTQKQTTFESTVVKPGCFSGQRNSCRISYRYRDQ